MTDSQRVTWTVFAIPEMSHNIFHICDYFCSKIMMFLTLVELYIEPGASAKLTFDCDKCDCIEYLPPSGRLVNH